MPLVLEIATNFRNSFSFRWLNFEHKNSFILGLDINLLRAELLFNIYSDSITGVHKGLSLFVISCIFYE